MTTRYQKGNQNLYIEKEHTQHNGQKGANGQTTIYNTYT